MPALFRIAALLMMGVLPACGGSAQPAAVVCEVQGSDDACFRCQAQRCGAQLDRCYGSGFHEGRAVVGPIQRRCVWNEATSAYDRDCTYGLEPDPAGSRNGRAEDASLGAPDVPCGPLAVCLQKCGCGASCKAGCTTPSDAARTTYYSNDPRYGSASCWACESTYLTACVRQSCASECAPADAGDAN
jgi:hypothetical protein